MKAAWFEPDYQPQGASPRFKAQTARNTNRTLARQRLIHTLFFVRNAMIAELTAVGFSNGER